jgi:hypothetical protein
MSIIHSTTDEEATLAALLVHAQDSADLSFVEELLASLAPYRTVNPDVPIVHPDCSVDERDAAELGEAVFRGRGL